MYYDSVKKDNISMTVSSIERYYGYCSMIDSINSELEQLINNNPNLSDEDASKKDNLTKLVQVLTDERDYYQNKITEIETDICRLMIEVTNLRDYIDSFSIKSTKDDNEIKFNISYDFTSKAKFYNNEITRRNSIIKELMHQRAALIEDNSTKGYGEAFLNCVNS